MDRNMDEICAGIKLLRKCLDFETVTLAVKETTDIKACEVNIAKVPDYYPAGAEKILIKQVLGIELEQGAIPAKNGILVLNVQTVFAIYEAVCRNKRADAKLITVADLKSKTDYVVKARLGTTIQGIVEKLPLASGNIFVGGGAMQCRNAADDDLVDEKVNFIAVANFPKYKESPLCSGCGFCTANCPMGIRVDRISQLVEQGNLEAAKKYQPEKCMQCGNCSRVCLAGRNLAMRVKAAKEG
jgi:Na+-translocating ferredoxin:NAD+ oxidoreductase RnfC subunit